MSRNDTGAVAPSTRIIVRNLPPYVEENRVREEFSKNGGSITDCKIMRTRDGRSRRFAFIGFKSIDHAAEAIRYFNKTFMDTARLEVEFAQPMKSNAMAKPWSKYSKGSSAHDRYLEEKNAREQRGEKIEQEQATKDYKDSARGMTDLEKQLRQAENDPKLKEFLDLHASKTSRLAWVNDDVVPENTGTTKDEDNEEADDSRQAQQAPEVATDQNLDDMAYLRKKSGLKPAEHPSRTEPAAAEGFNDNEEEHAAIEGDPDEDTPVEQSRKHVGDEEELVDHGRLFLRNLSYGCKEGDLEAQFKQYGPVAEVHMPIDFSTKKSKGIAYVTYVMPEHAVAAYEALDGTIFQGRILHILPAAPKKEDTGYDASIAKEGSSYKKQLAAKRKAEAGQGFNWNTLFMRTDTVASAVASQMGVDKRDILNPEQADVAVRVALSETKIIQQTKDFLVANGVSVDTFHNNVKERSKTTFLVKNLPFEVKDEEMKEMFEAHGSLKRLVVPPTKTIAIIEYHEPSEARKAFRSVAYKKFRSVPLYLEWAPIKLWSEKDTMHSGKGSKTKQDTSKKASSAAVSNLQETDQDVKATLFVKNLNFNTHDDALRIHMEQACPVVNAHVAMKFDKAKQMSLSMGYGFVTLRNEADAHECLKRMQGSKLDGHALELKLSHRTTKSVIQKAGVDSDPGDEGLTNGTKLLIRNVPFEATHRDLMKLIGAFGQLKSLRLPKKMDGSHKGFAFADFVSKEDAKYAHDSLFNTHFYGRHMVIEWAKEEKSVDDLRKDTRKHYRTSGSGTSAQDRKRARQVIEEGGLMARSNDDDDADDHKDP